MMTDATIANPRRYTAVKRDLKRAEIVAAATREMNEHGVQGLVLADVAARVGMTKANLTYYFRRKEDLAALCIGQTLDAYQAMIAQAAGQPTARTRFLALYLLFFERAARAAHGLEAPLVVLGSPRALEEPYGAEVTRHYTEMLRAAAALFDSPDALPMGRVDRLTRAQLALTHLFWAAAWIRNCDPGDYPRIAHRLFDIVADGLAPPDGARRGDPGQSAAGDEDQRAGFYQAATRVINLLGYRGASIDRIGAAVNVTKGSVYHHHQSKDELVLACSERSFTAMWIIIRSVEAAADDRWAQVSGLVEALARHQLGATGPFLRASVLSALPEPLRDTLVVQWARIINHLAGLVSDGVAEGTIRAVDPALSAQVIAAGLNATDEIGGFLGHRGIDDVTGRCVEPTLFGLFSSGRGPTPTEREPETD
jgi:AcrR family transcriptional regulator